MQGRTALAAVTALALALVPGAARSLEPTTPHSVSEEPEPRFGERIDVGLVTVVVRVVDGTGAPLSGLTSDDFRVWVGDRNVRPTSTDWVGEEAPRETAPSTPATAASVEGSAVEPAERFVPAPAGAQIVFFVQADNNEPGRTRGHLHTLANIQEMLGTLPKSDRLAVLSFGAHLKLWQDFTTDRGLIPGALYKAVQFGGEPPVAPDQTFSLAHTLDLNEAFHAASPERALEVTAHALAQLPGEKAIVFVGWGLGSFGSFGTHMAPAFAPAVRALKAARATVFALDVTEADSHDLELGLQSVAEETGGTYDKTNVFPQLALAQLSRTLSGYYVLTLDQASLPAQGGWVRVELRQGHGTVLLRPRRIPVRHAS
jgi:VWFA-related protein